MCQVFPAAPQRQGQPVERYSGVDLNRCVHRHGISRRPDMTGDRPAKQKLKVFTIGYFHIDIAEVRTKEGKIRLYVGIDRTSKFAFVQFRDKADRSTAVGFVEALFR